MKANPNNNLFGWLSLLIVAGYFMVGYWPFDFRTPNHVAWLADRPGLHFAPYGIAYDAAPLPASAPQPSATFTLELRLAAQHEPANNIFDILTVHNAGLPLDFVLCQWKQDFLLRGTTEPRQRAGKIPEVDVEDALPKGKPQIITVRSDGTGTDFYLNGKAAEHYGHFTLNAQALDGQLILGNNASGKHSWTGSFLGLAIYDRALDAAEIGRHFALWNQDRAGQLANEPGIRALYLLDDGHGQEAEDSSGHHHHLVIPAGFEPVSRAILIAPWTDLSYHHPDYSDIVVNILGFVPFGFCFFLHRRRRRPQNRLKQILFTIFTGAAVSLAIEIVQAWLPNRVSSQMDLLTNTIGTMFGVALALAMHARRVASSPTIEENTRDVGVS